MQQEMTLDKQNESEKGQASSLFETAETIQINALNLARRKLPPGEKDGQLAGLLERQDFLRYFKYALAQEVAQVVAAYDQGVQAIYLFDRITNAEAADYPLPVDMTIQLLALVTSASAALEVFVASLGRTLTVVLLELPWSAFAGRSSFLDVVIVTESDIKDGGGYAPLFSSDYAGPQKIWEHI